MGRKGVSSTRRDRGAVEFSPSTSLESCIFSDPGSALVVAKGLLLLCPFEVHFLKLAGQDDLARIQIEGTRSRRLKGMDLMVGHWW